MCMCLCVPKLVLRFVNGIFQSLKDYSNIKDYINPD